MALLDPSTLVKYSCFILFFVLLVQKVRAYLRLSHIPGPLLASISSLWLIRASISGQIDHISYDLNKRAGPLVRISPNRVLLGDGKEWRRICGARSPYRRGSIYEAFRFKPRTDSVVTYRDEEKHEDLRKKMAAGYSGKENHALEQSVDNQISNLINVIENKYVSNDGESKRLELARTVSFFTLDVISDIAFSHPFGDLTHDQDVHEYIKSSAGAMKLMNLLAFAPLLRKIVQHKVLDYFAPSVQDSTGLGPIIRIAQEEVATRYGSEKKDKWDMLGSFVRHGLTQEDAESETVLQVFAGSDTTSTAMRATLLYIITTPEVLIRLRQEIDQIKASPISYAAARELPYLQAVIKEGLRMFPPVPGLQDKVTPPEGDLLCGYQLPGGVEVSYNALAYQRDPVFGSDPDVFRPMRWLTVSSPDRLAEMERTVDLVFSAGRYHCLGKNIAFMELNKLYVELFRRFDFALCNPEKPWTSNAYALHVQKDFWVRVTRRT